LPDPFVFALAVTSTHLFAGADGGGIFRSSDAGASWTAVNSGLTNTRILSIGASGNNLYAGTFGSGIFRSTNNGDNWTMANSGLVGTEISAIARCGGFLFAGTSNGVFRSGDEGGNWVQADSGITSRYVHAFASSATTILAGTDGDGVFRSSDNGTTWTPASTGLANTSIWAILALGTHLFAGSNGDGIWRRPLSEIVISGTNYSYNLPSVIRLLQNFPNPFNPSTTIKYDLPTDSRVSLTILNVLGQEIATLVNEEQWVGARSVEWNGSGFASGVYYYRLQAGDYVSLKKMLLLK